MQILNILIGFIGAIFAISIFIFTRKEISDLLTELEEQDEKIDQLGAELEEAQEELGECLENEEAKDNREFDLWQKRGQYEK